MEETWQPVYFLGEDTRYDVSTFGRVRRRYKYTKKLLRPFPNRQGYLAVHLWIGTRGHGYKKGMLVHRLVVVAFIGPVIKPMTVNHKNGIKADNRLGNLEIISHADNNRHAYRVLGKKPNPPKGSAHGRARLTEAQIPLIREMLAQGLPQYVIAEKFGVHQTTIACIAVRKTWGHI